MGYIAHHCIVVTSWEPEKVKELHSKATALDMTVSPIVHSPTNSYTSFFVAPDGSEEGWMESDKGNKNRELFKTELRKAYVEWAEVRYSPDDREALITDCEWSIKNAKKVS